MTDEEKAISRVKTARAKMLVKHPFFATLMMAMPMVFTTDIPTCATDMKKLYFNPAFVSSVDDDVLLFALAHEIMHTALQHGLRQQTRNKRRWNIATDFSINLTLKDTGFKVWSEALLDEKYRDEAKHPMGADRIERMLPEDEQAGGGGGAGAGGEGDDPNDSPMLGDLLDPDELSDPVAAEQLSRDIQQRVAQAATVAKMMGEMPDSLERFVNGIIDPKVPWFETLRHLMTEFAAYDEDWSQRNRRFPGVYLPSDNSECRLGEFIAIGDTSGSISDEEMASYMAEFRAVAEACKPERMRIVWADAKVQGEQEFDEHDEIEPRPKGGGGTDMRVPLEHCEQYDPKIVVLFTDGYTPWPAEEPPYPLIVCCTTAHACPVGEVIRI
jgi:predicted metal-dependent peptidase